MSDVPSKSKPATTWLNKGEKGALLGIRLAYGMATLFGRGPARVLVRVIA
jgi:hypothetical protein